MAQSASDSKETPLHIEAFWEKTTATPSLTWIKWTQQWKLALLAKEGIQLDTLLSDPPATVTYPPEPTYEATVENHTQATERDRKVRNQQLKVNWQNRCAKIEEIGILCGDKPWGICEQKTISLLYLSIGTEGRRIFKSKYPHFQIEKQPFKDLWRAMEDSFTKVRNITYDRFVFYSCKQQKGESVESFYGRLIELAENCSLGSEETTLIRDAFILNMLDHETQKELLKETVDPPKALEIAIQMEMGAQNQQKINQNLMSGNTSVNYINNNSMRNRNANGPSTKRNFTRYASIPKNYQYTSICMDCGLRWSHNHKQICPANGKKCHTCGIMGHFARKSRKTKLPQLPIQKTEKSIVNQIDQTPEKSDDEESVNYITSYQQLYDQVYDSNYDSDSDDYVAAISSDSVHQLEPLNVEVQIGEIQTSAMIDSGSAVGIITQSLANKVLRSTNSAKWIKSTEKRNLKTFSNEPIKVIGHLETTVAYNQWQDKSAILTVVDDGHKNIIGRDLFTTLGLAVVQQQPETGKCVYNINNPTCKIKESIATQFPHLVSRIGLSKTHVAKSKFHQTFTAKHQKGRRVPINLQPRVSSELERLQIEGHIEKLSSCSDELFISKYQMPNIEMLIDTISRHLTDTQNGQQAYFTTLDLKYAYSQLKLHHDTAKHCNCNIICGESTGTYRFKTGFYGLTDMPAEFQKAMDYTLIGL